MRTFAALAAAAGFLLSQAVAQEVPRPAPEFAVHLTNGSQVSLSQFRGKIVILAFMFTTCPHCQRSIPILNGIQKDYGPRGVQIVGATFNDNAAQLVGEFNAKYQPVFPVGYVTRESALGYQAHPPWKRGYVPEFLIIDRKQVIREQHSGEEEFFTDVDKSVRTILDNLLKESVASGKSSSGARKIVKKTS